MRRNRAVRHPAIPTTTVRFETSRITGPITTSSVEVEVMTVVAGEDTPTDRPAEIDQAAEVAEVAVGMATTEDMVGAVAVTVRTTTSNIEFS
jgi:hypothetical protein